MGTASGSWFVVGTRKRGRRVVLATVPTEAKALALCETFRAGGMKYTTFAAEQTRRHQPKVFRVPEPGVDVVPVPDPLPKPPGSPPGLPTCRDERLLRLACWLRRRGEATVAEAVVALGVAAITVRRLLDGGAGVRFRKVGSKPPYRYRVEESQAS